MARPSYRGWQRLRFSAFGQLGGSQLSTGAHNNVYGIASDWFLTGTQVGFSLFYEGLDDRPRRWVAPKPSIIKCLISQTEHFGILGPIRSPRDSQGAGPPSRHSQHGSFSGSFGITKSIKYPLNKFMWKQHDVRSCVVSLWWNNRVSLWLAAALPYL